MPVVSESAAVIAEDNALESTFRHRISWSSIFVGATVGTATIFFLLTLGSGVGLSLVPAHGVANKGFLTLGAIYFLAAQAMGFAVGGHLVGRLIGPMAETDREEEFRAAAHGLSVWGLCVSATAVLILVSSWVAAGSGAIAAGMGLTSANSSDGAPTPMVAAYWTDVLFRPATAPMHTSLAWRRYAQAGNTVTDATPATDDESQSAPRGTTTQMTPVPNSGNVESDTPQGATAGAVESTSPQSGAAHVITIPTPAEGTDGSATATNSTGAVAITGTHDLAADKAEVGRILQTNMANSGTLDAYDNNRIADLISQDTGVSTTDAARRTDNALARIRSDQAKAAEAARKLARNASLWIAFALLFGAIIATMAAISARWEDDRITFGFGPPRTRVAATPDR